MRESQAFATLIYPLALNKSWKIADFPWKAGFVRVEPQKNQVRQYFHDAAKHHYDPGYNFSDFDVWTTPLGTLLTRTVHTLTTTHW